MSTARGAGLALLLLVAVSTGRSLGNGFAFDDLPIVVENPQVHALAPPWVYAGQSYWPPDNLGDAYRPWTVWWLAIQWAVGGGQAWVFHLVNLLLAAGVTGLLFLLARELLPPGAALAAAALFAVHPVHVEATANIVGQGELWMAGFSLLAALVYVRARRRGAPGPASRWTLAGLLLLAAASKEQGVVLPALLLVLEPALPAAGRRVRDLLPTYALLGVAGIAFLAGRYLVLGDLGGGPPAAGLAGLGVAGRAAAMAPVTLEWLRLLIWPRHLLAQYSPPGTGGPGPTVATLAGPAAILALAAVAILTRRRAPVISTGIAWAGVALLPVSNLLVPTGILLAERTLLLPSAGAVLVGGALVALAARRPRALIRVAAAAGVAVLVVAGVARSWSRQAVWRDNETLFTQTVADGPDSYRAWFLLGRDFQRRAEPARAKAAYARAARLYRGDRRVYEDWGQSLRREGRCDLAVPVFEQGVTAEPAETTARSRLFECLITLGRYSEALAVAEEGVRLGGAEFEPGVRRARSLLVVEMGPPPATHNPGPP